ncbi:lysylphosphatidylglycerol synthase transmembrane domain-containing protein [Modestobacter roseus]|uniref:Uncharacterized protein (TIRG00374 family) n=1 Tax=Modestobacter roseus TaxID=1181884 RepID=A0A562IPA8_9ACTN|nr:YbhN family protein [Modestobacter roseus]TWH72686.1 uncharacterized protein (TIRG00374 family) [Modestobacter roseus]
MTPGRAGRLRTGPGLRLLLTVAVIGVVFLGVLPRVADYSDAWRLVRALTWPETLSLLVVATVNLLSYAPVWVAALPGLTWGRAVETDLASTAISNTVPAGFAFGVGATATMYHSFGHGPAAITRAVALTGIWNNLVKLAMPVAALVALAVTGHATRALAVTAVLGTGVLLLVVGALVAGLVHPGAAAALAATAERVARAAARQVRRPGPADWVARVDRFRADSLAVLRRRWAALTAAAVASHTALFLLLLTTLRFVDGAGAGVSWPQLLAVFAVTRLVTLVPVTPGALGVAELSYVAGLTTVGVDATAAAGVVLLFRFLTWFLPVPLGIGAWVLWRRGTGRADAPTPAAELSAR